MRAEQLTRWVFLVLWQVSKHHAVVGEHLVDFVGKAPTTFLRKAAPPFPGPRVELDVGELGDAVDDQEQDELAACAFQFVAVNVDIADVIGLESLALFDGLRRRQSRDAMVLEASMQGAAAEVGDGTSQAAEEVVQRQQGSATDSTT